MLEGHYAEQALGLLRMVAGLLFMLHGSSKLFGFPPRTEGGRPKLGTLMWFAGMIELFGGLLIMIGFAARPAAFLASGEMAVAYWTVHAKQSLYPSNNGGDAAILFCFVFLLIVVAGPGAFSLGAQNGLL